MDWHARFQQQARWTKDLRDYLYPRAGIANAQRVLEVGCGTGAILADLASRTQGAIFGLDIQFELLSSSVRNALGTRLAQGDALSLPYAAGSFDLTFCHFLLLWVADPGRVLAEMKRVTRPGGAVLALAEPDYGGRIDYPDELGLLGEWQQTALEKQGADPKIGRRLGAIFQRAGLESVESGVLGGQWKGKPSQEEGELEWAVLQSDLEKISPFPEITPDLLEKLKARDRSAREHGERLIFVPTFYAWGRVEDDLRVYP